MELPRNRERILFKKMRKWNFFERPILLLTYLMKLNWTDLCGEPCAQWCLAYELKASCSNISTCTFEWNCADNVVGDNCIVAPEQWIVNTHCLYNGGIRTLQC